MLALWKVVTRLRSRSFAYRNAQRESVGAGRFAVDRSLIALLACCVVSCQVESPGRDDRDVTLATTTSVRDAGLLHAILSPFERASGYRVKVIAVGSGQALALGRRGEADILLTHDPDGERAFVAEGYGLERLPLMHNEFVLVGPPDDPAHVRGVATAEAALQRIVQREALFVSRGDRSGTNTKELALWEASAATPDRLWYRESGQGMSATLQIASQLRAYTLTDVGTLLSHRSRLDLAILVEGDPALHNPYHVMVVNPARFGWLNADGARALSRYLLAPETQAAIAAYGRSEFGRSLFLPDALRAGADAALPDGN